MKIRSPEIDVLDANGGPCHQGNVTTTIVQFTVADPDSPASSLSLYVEWVVEGFPNTLATTTVKSSGGVFTITVGPYNVNDTNKFDNYIDLTATASDGTKRSAPKTFTAVINLVNCDWG